jgi:cytochrome c553
MHYQRLRAESSAPSCATCHQPHSFKVLKASELAPLCSVCHNEKDQATSANVPVDAKLALEKATELQNEIVTAKNSLSAAKAKGRDVSLAQIDLDKATSVMEDVPSLWHSFNLKNFDKQIQTGIDSAKKAQTKLTEVEPTVPPVPGIGIVAVLGIITTLYIIRKK